MMLRFSFTCLRLASCNYCNCLHFKNSNSTKPLRKIIPFTYFSTVKSQYNKSDHNLHEKQSKDPIVAKYKKIIKEIGKNNAENVLDEKIYETNFGSIRFDSDNVVSPKIIESLPHKSESKDDTFDLNYMDEYYFQESLSSNISNTEINLNHMETSTSYIDKVHCDLNYIDSQYLAVGNSSENINSSPLSTSREGILNLDFVDSQYFDLNNPENEKGYPELNSSHSIASDLNYHSDYNTKLVYSFEDSLSLVDKFVIDNESNHKKQLSRDYLEEQLIHLSDKTSELLLRKNPKVQKAKEVENEDTQVEPESEVDLTRPFSIPTEEIPAKKLKIINNVRSALSYVKEKRKEELKKTIKEIKGEILPHENYKKIIINIPSFTQHTQTDFINHLKSTVLYNKNGIVAISKPYGIPMHEGGGSESANRLNLVKLLPHLAEALDKPNLFATHRLDKNATGVLLLADNDETASKLKKMFKEHAIQKTYLAITKGIPHVLNGVIDIPVIEGKTDKYQRMTLFIDAPGFRKGAKYAKKAITRFKVLSKANSCALVELNPITGAKHQLRVHLAFGLSCPVLGDHKYSTAMKVVPQKLPGDALQKLGLPQSRVRHLPLHLHSFIASIPGMREDGGEIVIKTGPPKFFKISLTALKLSSRKNRLPSDFQDIIYGFE